MRTIGRIRNVSAAPPAGLPFSCWPHRWALHPSIDDLRRGSTAAMRHLRFRDTSTMIPQPDDTSPWPLMGAWPQRTARCGFQVASARRHHGDARTHAQSSPLDRKGYPMKTLVSAALILCLSAPDYPAKPSRVSNRYGSGGVWAAGAGSGPAA